MTFLSRDLWSEGIAPLLPRSSHHALLLTNRFLHTLFEPLAWSFLNWDNTEHLLVDAQVTLVLEVPRLAAHVQKVRLYPWEDRTFPYEDVLRALKKMPRLRTLELQNVRLTQGLYMFLYESIVELKMAGTIFPNDLRLSPLPYVDGNPRETKLQTLILQDDPSQQELSLLLTNSPALRHVAFSCPRDLSQLTQHIRGGCWVSLHALHISSWTPGTVPELTSILPHLPELRSLHFTYSRHNLPTLTLPETSIYVPRLEEFCGMPSYAAVLCRGRPIHTAELRNFAYDDIVPKRCRKWRTQSLQTQSFAQERALLLAHNKAALYSLKIELTDPLLLRHLRNFPNLRHLVISGYDLYAPFRDKLRMDNTPRVMVMISVLARALPFLHSLTSLEVRGLPIRFDLKVGFAGILKDVGSTCPSLRTLRCPTWDHDLLWVWLAKDEWKLVD